MLSVLKFFLTVVVLVSAVLIGVLLHPHVPIEWLSVIEADSNLCMIIISGLSSIILFLICLNNIHNQNFIDRAVKGAKSSVTVSVSDLYKLIPQLQNEVETLKVVNNQGGFNNIRQLAEILIEELNTSNRLVKTVHEDVSELDSSHANLVLAFKKTLEKLVQLEVLIDDQADDVNALVKTPNLTQKEEVHFLIKTVGQIEGFFKEDTYVEIELKNVFDSMNFIQDNYGANSEAYIASAFLLCTLIASYDNNYTGLQLEIKEIISNR